MLRYDIGTGVKKIKTKTALTISGAGIGIAGLLMATVMPIAAHASVPFIWKINAPNAITFNCGVGDYSHTLNTVNQDLTSGSFTGTGSWNDSPSAYTWDITGAVTGNNINFHVLYTGTGNPGYTLDGTGAISPDGSIAGNLAVTDNCQTFTMPAGTATQVVTSFNWGSKVNPSQCANRVGGVVLNVTVKVKNDPDSGIKGNDWAMDNFNKEVQVWKTRGVNQYCAVVRYEGMFTTNTGFSPGGTTANLPSGITGTMMGGYVATFSNNAPKDLKNGHLLTIDLSCTTGCNDQTGWLDKYFPGTGDFNQTWWGWIYTSLSNGSIWVNSSDGNAGDITG